MYKGPFEGRSFRLPRSYRVLHAFVGLGAESFDSFHKIVPIPDKPILPEIPTIVPINNISQFRTLPEKPSQISVISALTEAESVAQYLRLARAGLVRPDWSDFQIGNQSA